MPLHPDFRVDVIQLSRVQAFGTGLADANLGRWCRFLNEAAEWRTIPSEVYGPEPEHAMKAIDAFRSDAERNAIYQARLNYQLERSAEREELEEMRVRVEEERVKLEAAREAEQAAREAAEAARGAEQAARGAEREAKEAALAELAALRARVTEQGR